MGVAHLCNVLLVINVVTVFGYILIFTHSLYILLGGVSLHSVNTEAGMVPAPEILPASPMYNAQKKLLILLPLACSRAS